METQVLNNKKGINTESIIRDFNTINVSIESSHRDYCETTRKETIYFQQEGYEVYNQRFILVFDLLIDTRFDESVSVSELEVLDSDYNSLDVTEQQLEILYNHITKVITFNN